MNTEKSIYFISDFHLGTPTRADSLIREKALCAWLDHVAPNAKAIFLLGDIFDFWFEYKFTAPKGYVRLLGALARISDAGIPLYLFTGNHDMWMFGYLEEEIGLKIFRQPAEFEFYGKKILTGHGDGLGKGDSGYKLIKKFFSNRLCIWLFARLHPNFSFSLAQFLSRRSRFSQKKEETFEGEEKEWLIGYCREQLSIKPFDYFIFGHRHLVIDFPLNSGSRYINLGHWLEKKGTYAELHPDGSLSLKSWPIKHS